MCEVFACMHNQKDTLSNIFQTYRQILTKTIEEKQKRVNQWFIQQISMYLYDLKEISWRFNDYIARDTSSIERYTSHPFFSIGS